MRHKVGRRYWGTWEWVLSGADALCIKKEAKNPHVKTPKSGQIYKCAYFPLSPKGGTRERRIKEIRGFQITGREPQCKKIEIRGAQFPAYIYRTKQKHSKGGQGYPVSFDINEQIINPYNVISQSTWWNIHTGLHLKGLDIPSWAGRTVQGICLVQQWSVD